MAKDTSNTGKDSSGNEFERTKNDVVKKGLAKNAQRADEAIVAQSKDASNPAIQAGNEARMEGLPSAGSVPKNPNVSDPLTPKPTVEPLSLGRETGKSKRAQGTGRREKTGILNFGTLPKKAESPFDSAATAENRIDRLQSGMGLPGSQNGDLDLALKLHARDLSEAKSSGKVVNDVHPTDSPLTSHIQISTSKHHTAFARVQRVMGIADHEVYKNAASAAGVKLPTYIQGVHARVQQHEDSKASMTHEVSNDDFWEHPTTKEIIPVAAKHPDMPMEFKRSKGLITKVTRGADGAEVLDSGYKGWDKTTSRGGKGGKTVLRHSEGPTKGIDLVDHLRSEMLNNHGSSTTSRKKGADIAQTIADTVSGRIPRGMVQIGTKKGVQSTLPSISSRPEAVTRPHGSSTQPADKKYRYSPANVETSEPLLVPKAPTGPKADKRPSPPKAKKGQVLLGSKPPAELPDFSAKGPRMVQDKLPGTGVPRTVSEEVTPAKVTRGSGPLEQRAYDLEGTPVGKSKWKLEDFYPKIETAPAVRTTRLEPTNRDFKPQNNPNRGQQFKVDVTSNQAGPGQKIGVDTTFTPTETTSGLDDLRTIKSAGKLSSQKLSSSTELEVRPGGKKQARKDAKLAKSSAPKTMVQPSMFPDFSVKEGRNNAFYMAGSVVPISEKSKTLQETAKQPFGRQPNNKDFETENEASLTDRTNIGSGEDIMNKFRKEKGYDPVEKGYKKAPKTPKAD